MDERSNSSYMPMNFDVGWGMLPNWRMGTQAQGQRGVLGDDLSGGGGMLVWISTSAGRGCRGGGDCGRGIDVRWAGCRGGGSAAAGDCSRGFEVRWASSPEWRMGGGSILGGTKTEKISTSAGLCHLFGGWVTECRQNGKVSTSAGFHHPFGEWVMEGNQYCAMFVVSIASKRKCA